MLPSVEYLMLVSWLVLIRFSNQLMLPASPPCSAPPFPKSEFGLNSTNINTIADSKTEQLTYSNESTRVLINETWGLTSCSSDFQRRCYFEVLQDLYSRYNLSDGILNSRYRIPPNMTQDTCMTTSDEHRETTPAITFQVEIRGPPPQDEFNPQEPVFDAVRCADLHNKIIKLISDLQPSLRPHIKRNLFTLAPDKFRLAQRREGDDDPSGPIPEQQLRDRFGPELSKFFELIDIIHVDEEQAQRAGPLWAYETPFVPPFSSPDPTLFFDFEDMFNDADLDSTNILQLYPIAYLYSVEAQTGGIMFDMNLCLASFAQPMDNMIPDQKSWVPLDVILNEWIKMIENGKISRDDSDGLCENEWTDSTFDSALTAWNDYLEILEQKMKENGEIFPEEVSQKMVDEETLQKWEESLNKMTLSFLKAARRPASGIDRIGPGLSCFTNDLFNAIHEGQRLRDENPTNDQNLLRELTSRQQRAQSEWLTSLLFPGVGDHTTIPDQFDEYGMDRSCEGYLGSDLTNRNAGLYILGNLTTTRLIDHDGGIGVFQRKDRCPWGMNSDLSLADMFRAWGIMIKRGLWRVSPSGVEGDFSWFAENREVEWVPNTAWGCEEYGGMKNDWVEWEY